MIPLPLSQANHWAKVQLWEAGRRGIVLPFRDGTIRLAAAEKDRSLFSQGLIMLATAESLLPDAAARAAFAASPQMITDASGQAVVMTVQELRGLLVAYGQAYLALWAAANAPAPTPPPQS